MAKAIKHITAGLLHIEILGTVPARPPGWRRGGRAEKTSAAQQFYNDKCSWRELELRLAAGFGRRDWVLTVTYSQAHLPADKREAGRYLGKFIRRVRESRRKHGAELRYVCVTEGFHDRRGAAWLEGDGELEHRRLHHHLVVNAAGPGDLDELRSLWTGGGYIRAEPLDVHYYRELAKYLTKEAREFGRPRPGERTWRASRNIPKPQVEYIEIPSDSVTLAPPSGAVDYEPFAMSNPYGFAACVGARYLLFPQRERAAHSYSQPRDRKKKTPP